MPKSFTQHHAYAFASPCFHAEETAHPGYRWRGQTPLDWLTFVLTVNVGLE